MSSDLAKELINNSGATFGSTSLKNVKWDKFNVQNLINDKADIGVSDALLNRNNFASYWKKRGKKEGTPYLLAEYDIDGDNVADLIAYRKVGADNIIHGFNKYYHSGEKTSQDAWKRNYYKQSADERQKQSYADYFMENIDSNPDWLNADKKKKLKDSNEKKLITKVKSFFKDCGSYAGLTKAHQTKFANIFINILADSMIDNDANTLHAQVVKQQPGFIEAKRSIFEHILFNNAEIKGNKDAIVINIIKGNAADIEDKLTSYIPDEYFISKDDAKAIFDTVTLKKASRKPRTLKSDDIAYTDYMKRYNSNLTAPAWVDNFMETE